MLSSFDSFSVLDSFAIFGRFSLHLVKFRKKSKFVFGPAVGVPRPFREPLPEIDLRVSRVSEQQIRV